MAVWKSSYTSTRQRFKPYGPESLMGIDVRREDRDFRPSHFTITPGMKRLPDEVSCRGIDYPRPTAPIVLRHPGDAGHGRAPARHLRPCRLTRTPGGRPAFVFCSAAPDRGTRFAIGDPQPSWTVRRQLRRIR